MSTVDLHQSPLEGVTPEPHDLQMWSVTTILKCLASEGLIYWAAEEAALCAIRQQRTWQAMRDEQGEEEAALWIRDARFRRPKGQRSAAELGTLVHDACEQYALSGERPEVDEEVAPFLDQFDRWLDAFQPEYQATEVTVYNPTYGYAGTCDGFLSVDGVRLIIDYKTSRKSFDKKGKPTGPYPEVGLQLAAYRFAEGAAVWRPRRMEKYRRRYYLLSPEERALAVPVPEVDGGAVIHITPEHCEMYPIRCDEEVYQSFLYVQEAARWQFQTSKNVIGAPMDRPQRQDAA